MTQPSNDDAHFAALGRVTAASTLMEDRIHLAVWSLIGPDQIIGQIVTAELGYRGLVTLLMALASHRLGSGPLLNELRGLARAANTAQKRRDKLVHSIWGDDLGPAGRRRIKRTAKEKGLNWEFEAVTPKQMLALADRFKDLADQFDDFNVRLRQAG